MQLVHNRIQPDKCPKSMKSANGLGLLMVILNLVKDHQQTNRGNRQFQAGRDGLNHIALRIMNNSLHSAHDTVINRTNML